MWTVTETRDLDVIGWSDRCMNDQVYRCSNRSPVSVGIYGPCMCSIIKENIMHTNNHQWDAAPGEPPRWCVAVKNKQIWPCFSLGVLQNHSRVTSNHAFPKSQAKNNRTSILNYFITHLQQHTNNSKLPPRERWLLFSLTLYTLLTMEPFYCFPLRVLRTRLELLTDTNKSRSKTARILESFFRQTHTSLKMRK